eukprot:scaffold440836_cov15-Prasinocladus_malaysianus.AAC.1
MKHGEHSAKNRACVDLQPTPIHVLVRVRLLRCRRMTSARVGMHISHIGRYSNRHLRRLVFRAAQALRAALIKWGSYEYQGLVPVDDLELNS